jgi:hypothetical protein
MRKLFFIAIFFSTTVISQVEAQRFVLPDQPDSLGSDIKALLYHQRSEAARELGDQTEQMWYDGTIGIDEQRKILDHLGRMIEKGLSPAKEFRPYFSAIANAKITEGIDTQKFGQYLNVASKVIDAYDRSLISQFFKTINTFFEHRAIYFDKSNQLLISDDSYQFEFVAPPEIIEILPEEEEPVEEEDSEEEYNEDEDWDDDDDDWDDEESDDNWDDEEDENWDEDEESGDGGSIIDALFTEEATPLEEGPVIRFDKVTLNIVTGYDSVFISNTKGALLINDRLFSGQGGRFDWPTIIKDSVESSPIYATLYDYNFEVKKSTFTANKVLLTYDERLNEAIEGTFEFKSVKHDSTHVYYPHFTSFNSNISIKGLGNENIRYQGGFSLKGHEISSSSVLSDRAQIDYIDDTGRKFKTVAPIFEFGDSVIIAKQSATTIYNGYDSLYHPSVKFKFGTTTEKLIIQKSKGTHYNTPFYESFFNMNINADIVRWDLNKDSLDISLLGGRKELAAIFESVEHFDSLDFRYLSGTYNFHPLKLLAGYSKRAGDQFYVDDLAKKYKLSENALKSAMQHMDQTGFITYNKGTGEINIKPKLFHYVKAYSGKKDYDDIIIKSKIDTASNAVYDMKEKTLLIRGVKELYLSDPLNVRIEPDSSEILLTGDRNFVFDGRIIAGNFEYIGRDYEFEYDSFLVRLGHVDSIKLYIKKKTKSGRTSKTALDNTLSPGGGSVSADVSGGSGTLYINRPDNKSGKEKLASYPQFDAGIGAVVRFNRKEILNGIYGDGVFFEAPPFAIDSLNDSDPASIKFKGVFVSDGIFPVIEEKLHVMDDYSLGFDHKVPEDGYQLFEGVGRMYGDISLNKQGIRGNGNIDFLAATLNSNDFIYYPDSVFAEGPSMEIREEEHNGVIFPQMTLTNFDLHWLPKKDSMYIYNLDEPFQLYNQSASLDGMTTMTSKGVFGKGSLITRGSEMTSDDYKFDHNQFSARHAQFEIKSDNPDKPVLRGDDVKLKFNLEENYANISPEQEGAAALSFPYAQMNTSITNARWDLNQQKIFMRKPKNTPLESSYFYTVNEDLDSLSFYATAAEYDMNSLEMKVSGIPYIIVADAKITPEGGEVLIHENSRIGQLTNTTIILDTLNGYHRLYDGVIDIVSRNEFSGYATYEYVNVLNDTFAIQMENFHLEQSLDSAASNSSLFNKKKGLVYRQHSVANGSVIDDDNILVSPGFFFKGDMILNADKPALNLDGYVRLDFKNQEHQNNWVKYTSEGNQQAVVISYDDATTEGGKRIEAGLHFSSLDNNLYSNFLEDKKGVNDDDFFTPGGSLFFNEETNEFMIEDPAKAAGESFAGKVFAYNEDTDDIRFEGPLNFFPPKKDASILASGLGRGNLETNQYNINSFLSMNFDIPGQAYQYMAADLLEIIEYEGVPDGLGDPTELLYKLGDIVGDQIAKAYEESSKEEYISIGSIAKEVARPLVFADVNLKWSDAYRAFYNEGKLGLSNILSVDVNGAFEGFMEIKKDEAGATIMNLFLKASADSWYFFGYEGDRLMLFSSNNNFNKYISSKSNASKAKAGELVFYPGSKVEVLDFINRFRRGYYEIEDYYDLGSTVEEEVEQEGGEGFGGDDTTEETPVEEEDDDDGF